MKTTSEQIESLQTELDKLKETYAAEVQKAAKKKSGVYVPEDGDECFLIDCDGEVDTIEFDNSVAFYQSCLEIGNIYRTREEAEEVVRNRKIHRFLQEQSDFVPDWKKGEQWKWFTCYDAEDNAFSEDWCYTFPRGTCVYFASLNGADRAADAAIEKFGRDAVVSYLTKGVM